MFELKITVETAEELADIATALETLAAHRIQRAADLAAVVEIQAEVLAGTELDRTLADADANRPLSASAAQLTGREPFMRLECQKLAAAELAAANAAAEATLQQVATLPNPFEEKPGPVTEDGMYQRHGVIYKVQKAVHGSGNLYAKRLDVDTKSFVYAPGELRNLTSADRMTLEAAKEFGNLYGICCRCAAPLTDEQSIADGIGPICKGKI